MILTDAGEVGVHVCETAEDGRTRTYLLRPSLYAMTQIGTPREIVETFSTVMNEPFNERGAEIQLQSALGVLFACTEEDVSEIFGHWGECEVFKTGYVPGRVPASDIVPLAQCLMKHGVTGALPIPEARPGNEPTFVQEFDARKHVAIAMAHLGVGEREAWEMTMTTLTGAMQAKYPPDTRDSPGAKAPSGKDLDAKMAWFDKIEAARAATKGNH